MHDIFISYAREDKEFVKTLALALEGEGWKVWWDRKITTGKAFDKEIEEAIDAARCVVVVWSEHSVESEWVSIEAGEGRHRDCLIPIMIEEVKIPLAFRRIQAANLIGWEGDKEAEYFQILRNDIAKLFDQPEKVKKVVSKPKKKKKPAENVQTQNEPPPAHLHVPTLNLTGRWASSMGVIQLNRTQGNNYTYQEYNLFNFQIGQGMGTLNGSHLTLNGYNNVAGNVVLNLTVNGNQLYGVATGALGSAQIAFVKK